MNDHDKALIETTKKCDITNWYVIVDMEKRAVSKEAKEILRDMSTRLHHKEEWFAEIL